MRWEKITPVRPCWERRHGWDVVYGKEWDGLKEERSKSRVGQWLSVEKMGPILNSRFCLRKDVGWWQWSPVKERVIQSALKSSPTDSRAVGISKSGVGVFLSTPCTPGTVQLPDMILEKS